MTREPVEPTKRAYFGPVARAEILARSDGHCAYPECQSMDRLEIDHVIAIWLGGKHTAQNAQALCYTHHKQKTKLDAKIRARTKRLIKGPTKSKRPMKSRGFGDLSRGFDGVVKPKRRKAKTYGRSEEKD